MYKIKRREYQVKKWSKGIVEGKEDRYPDVLCFTHTCNYSFLWQETRKGTFCGEEGTNRRGKEGQRRIIGVTVSKVHDV